MINVNGEHHIPKQVSHEKGSDKNITSAKAPFDFTKQQAPLTNGINLSNRNVNPNSSSLENSFEIESSTSKNSTKQNAEYGSVLFMSDGTPSYDSVSFMSDGTPSSRDGSPSTETKNLNTAENNQDKLNHFVFGDPFPQNPKYTKEKKPLGKGGFGEVFPGEISTTKKQIVVKVPNKNKNFTPNKDEYLITKKIEESTQKHMKAPGNLVGYQAGMGGITRSQYFNEKTGELIQPRIVGHDGFKSILHCKSPVYKRGIPDNSQEAIQRSAMLANELLALHSAGFVHCDMKLGNVMITDNGDLHIIDLGAAKKIGDDIGIHSSNGAPEAVYFDSDKKFAKKATIAHDMYCMGTMMPSILFGSVAKDLEISFRSKQNSSGKFLPSEFVKKMRNLSEEERTEKIKEDFRSYNEEMRNRNTSNNSAIANEIIDESKINFDTNTRNLIQAVLFHFLEIGIDNKFSPEELQSFLGKCGATPEQAEQLTQIVTSDKYAIPKYYPDEVLDKLAELTARLLNLDPSKRPSSEEALLILQNLGLSNWHEGQFNIEKSASTIANEIITVSGINFNQDTKNEIENTLFHFIRRGPNERPTSDQLRTVLRDKGATPEQAEKLTQIAISDKYASITFPLSPQDKKLLNL